MKALSLIGLATSLILTAEPGAAQSNAACNRACLNAHTDSYLAALLTHDPGALPLSPLVKFTENSAVIKIGEAGLWNTTTAVDPLYKFYLVDESTGTAGFIGRLEENGVPAYLAMRLKIVDGTITEIETVVNRGSSNARGSHPREPRPEFMIEAVGADKLSRRELIAISGKYFDAIQGADGNAAPFSEACNRIENGRQMTNNPWWRSWRRSPSRRSGCRGDGLCGAIELRNLRRHRKRYPPAALGRRCRTWPGDVDRRFQCTRAD
jgi:hypothetical protein